MIVMAINRAYINLNTCTIDSHCACINLNTCTVFGYLPNKLEECDVYNYVVSCSYYAYLKK